MKNGWIKVGADAPELRLGAVKENVAVLAEAAGRAECAGVKILAFPELCLTGATLGDLYRKATILNAAKEGLIAYVKATEKLDVLTFVGLPLAVGARIYNAYAAVKSGEILGITASLFSENKVFAADAPACDELTVGEYETYFGADFVYTTDEMPSLTLAVASGIGNTSYAEGAATLVVNPYAEAFLVGSDEKRKRTALTASASEARAILTVGAGSYESGTDGVYTAQHLITNCGRLVAETKPFAETAVYAVLDMEIPTVTRMKTQDDGDGGDYDAVSFTLTPTETEAPALAKSPFIPEDAQACAERCRMILEMQSTALAERAKRAFAKTFVVGVSGGLDSTLAVLVAHRALQKLGAPNDKLIAVTMPCFGTTARTRSNAEILSEELGATFRTVDIKAAVTQHFSDIGHAADVYDATYENAQARERTQVLMDIANSEGGLVVGTGDLSELALGWATYNGDHMAMYGVNAGIPKTLIRVVVSYCADEAEREGRPREARALRDVLATPVSPELLPPKDGEIAQRTEGLVGPYELHDFFLYYLLRYGFSPKKILRMATAAFAGDYTEEVIKGWLKVFLRRFVSQQFKRSCLPDGVGIGSVGISPRGGLSMPSDMSASAFLSELED